MAETKSKGFDYTKLNSLAVVSFALSLGWVGSVAGVVTGHFALAQIKRSGQRGRRLAIAGLIIGYAYIGLSLLWGMFMFGLALRGLIDHRGPMGMGHIGGFGDDRWGMMGGFDRLPGGLTPIQPLDPGTATAEPGQVNP